LRQLAAHRVLETRTNAWSRREHALICQRCLESACVLRRFLRQSERSASRLRHWSDCFCREVV
jgi:hypothetical protein